jgi:ATP synthase protein I
MVQINSLFGEMGPDFSVVLAGKNPTRRGAPLKKKSRFSYGSEYRELFKYSYVGLEMGFAVVIGVFVGHYLDTNTFEGRYSPWLTMLFMMFGIIAGFRAFFRAAKEMKAKLDKLENGEDRPLK